MGSHTPRTSPIATPRADRLDPQILARLETLGARLRPAARDPDRATASIHAALTTPGLDRGKVHEWIGLQDPEGASPPAPRTGSAHRSWFPPLTLITSAAAAAASALGRLMWIGERIWPYPASIPAELRDRPQRSLFVRASHPADRLWAIDLALRSRAVAAVIADGSGLDLAATRRLQLAAEAAGGMCILARPPWELAELSAASTRWLVSSAVSPTGVSSAGLSSSPNRRWTVELLRCKGVQPAHAQRTWVVEQDHATRALRVAADVLDRSGETQVCAATAS